MISVMSKRKMAPSGSAAIIQAMRARGQRSAFLIATLLLAGASPRSEGNLLRNVRFQDDWLTLLPETQNHHWCYSTAFQNRRDYNPDTWVLSGSWRWQNPDGPRESRQLILEGPRAEVSQRVNWVMVHDDRRREGFPDAGGFPAPVLQRSRNPLGLVRDLTLRVRVRGEGVPADAARIELSLSPPGAIAAGDPLGVRRPPTTSVTASLPEGTFAWQWVELRLPAAQWLSAANEGAAKDPKEAAAAAQGGTALPGSASVALRYSGPTGRIEIDRVELIAAEPGAPNLLLHGGFEGKDPSGSPLGWSRPGKYRYFPPALYYLFNTWHNATAQNRGPVTLDTLIPHDGAASLKMIVPAGDEVQVASAPIVLDQKEPRLIEVSAWVKTDHLNMLQIDGLDETGARLDGFNFIHKAPVSIGTDEWRRLRQVFRPRRPLRSLTLVLAARGVNGYTLGDTGDTPQANATGTVWWDEIKVFEPESTAAEIAARGIRIAPATAQAPNTPHLRDLDPGERLFGENRLTATLVNGAAKRKLALVWRFTTADGRTSEARSPVRAFDSRESALIEIPYTLTPSLLAPYTEHKGEVSLVDGTGKTVAASELWFSTWSAPLDLELGALYLAPEQKQFVRINLGFSAREMAKVASVRLDLVRRNSGAILKSATVSAGPGAVAAQRERIPTELREDFTNLLLTDFDVSTLPVQPFGSPERNWFVRATVIDASGREVFSRDSQPFCRQANVSNQSGVRTVSIDQQNLLRVNDEPFFPWGAIYGHVPVYAGAPGASRDLRNLPAWSIYDGFTSKSYTRAAAGFNVARYVARSITARAALEKMWAEDNRMASSAFVTPGPVFSLEELTKGGGGAEALAANLAFLKTAPMVVSIAPGIEEEFGLFHRITPAQISGLKDVVEEVRKVTEKPVMIGHGGYWNRFEFERAPFFDIYDPETEPLYPANLHTDLMPLIAGQAKTIWLRPQMYEDVPYERWRFHAYVELMRGARGFQIAHGPGDVSLFRGLGGELEGLKPVLWSKDPGPAVAISPNMEHWVRRHDGRTYVIAATTRGLSLGRWRWSDDPPGPHGRVRITEGPSELRDEANSYGVIDTPIPGPSLHGIQYVPDARRRSRDSRIVQWVWLDPQSPPQTLAVLAKVDGRFTHVASWGPFDVTRFRKEPALDWFLRSLYRHANGFLGWGKDLLNAALPYVPEQASGIGDLPTAGTWTKLEIPLHAIGSAGGLLDGVAFIHDGGRVHWGRTTIEEGASIDVLWGDTMGPNPAALGSTRIDVAGLKAGTKIKVLFEDREIVAGPGYFTDDFRGKDMYQRFGGGPGAGYGNDPVALHIYEIP